MGIEGRCDVCGFQPTLDYSCLRCTERERDAALLQVDGLRNILASVTVGFCRFCNCGGDAKLQNHLPECEVAQLLGITEQRKGAR